MATTFEKNVFRLFRLQLLLISSEMQMPGDPPLFLPAPPILNKQMRKDQTPEERQLMLDYGLLRNFKKDLMEGMK